MDIKCLLGWMFYSRQICLVGHKLGYIYSPKAVQTVNDLMECVLMHFAVALPGLRSFNFKLVLLHVTICNSTEYAKHNSHIFSNHAKGLRLKTSIMLIVHHVFLEI